MHFLKSTPRHWLPFLALALFAIPAGCSEEPGIQTYQAPREDVPSSIRPTGRDTVATTQGRGAPENADGLNYTPPAAWEDGESNSIRFDAFVASNGDQQVDVTVFAFPPSPLVANVNRWRGELGLPPQSEEEITAAMQTLMAAGEEVPYFEMNSPADAETAETTLAVILDAPIKQWYFKMRGPTEAVAAEKARFEEFIESIEFE